MLKMFAVMLTVVVAPMVCVDGATVAQYLRGTTVYSLFQDAGLTDLLTGDDPVTLFIPSDVYLLRYLSSHGTSLSQLRQNPEGLKDLLQYHVVSGRYARRDLYNEEKLQAVNGDTIRVNTYGTSLGAYAKVDVDVDIDVDSWRITAQGVAFQSRDYAASNGVIHFLYGIMEPANGTVADVIASQSDLSTLLSAAQAAGLVDFLADQNPITVFAPTDAAFNALGDTVQTLLTKPDLLAQILSYHVVPGTIYSAGIHATDLHTFEEADRLHLTSRFGTSFSIENGHLMRNGEDMSAINGVVHKIDHVLIPDSLKSQI
ncbi:hypothetical protein BaRGS_00005020 [Batillaria attramentaria]|uniref:FAS1 domain-containing protein n=1 Tax=Batillaria attramentaria TaxID=370345 RepID=A0ABD0LWJ8_9CAEN